MVRTADGRELRTSDDLSAWLDRPVTLTAAAGRPGGTYEVPLDFENEADWVSWQGPPDAWHDSTRTRVSLVSTATLGDWDVRRFRPNVVLDGEGEDALVGRSIRIGDVALSVTKPIDRCVIVTRAQPGLDCDLDILRTINRDRGATLAIGAGRVDGSHRAPRPRPAGMTRPASALAVARSRWWSCRSPGSGSAVGPASARSTPRLRKPTQWRPSSAPT
ncbi:MAG: MOSC domain-containing protein [Acidimicrobiales bacterium]